MIRLDSVTKTFPARRSSQAPHRAEAPGGPGALSGLGPITLAVPAGHTLVLLGPTGAGKSTILRLIAGLDIPNSGDILIGGTSVTRLPPHRRGVAFLPQRPALYPHLSVAENLALVGEVPPAARELLRLDELESRRPEHLSGGELQRAALGKLAASTARVWLLDEPFAALDVGARADFRADLHLLAGDSAATIVMVSHEPADAFALGTQVGVIVAGKLGQLGTPPRLADDPHALFTGRSLGRLGTVSGHFRPNPTGTHERGEFVSACGSVVVPYNGTVAVPSASALTLGIRPEAIRPDTDVLADRVRFLGWRVLFAEPTGVSAMRLTLAAPGSLRTRLIAEWTGGTTPPENWACRAEDWLWFDRLTHERFWPRIDRDTTD